MERFVFLILILFHSVILAEPALPYFDMPAPPQHVYKAPTQRFVEFHNYDHILQALKRNGLSLLHRNFFEHVIPHEEIGFFGYHSSTQGFRIYQDIIRIVIEEICKIKIKKDFHFLRIPGNPLLSRQSASQFLEDYPNILDISGEQQEQLLSMNYALFGNFLNFGSCSVYYFTKNHSATTVVFQNKLKNLFECVGLPIDKIPDLFLIGNPLTEANNAVLFQFFDFSHHNAFLEPYQLVDRMCYPALSGGRPEKINQLMSTFYLGDAPQPFTNQFRIVINNSIILNPYSPLTIKRYERTDPQIVKEYETQLREEIKKLPYDESKAVEYRQELFSLWGADDA